MHVLQNKSQFRKPSFNDQFNQYRKIIFVMLEDPQSSILAKFIQYIICFTILLSQIQILCDSLLDDNQYYIDLSYDCEILIFIVFAVEYIFRLSTYTVYGYTLKNFFFQHMNIIDLISIAPLSILSLIYGKTALNGLRVLKLFKVIRILKVKRYLKGVDILYQSVVNSITQFYFLILAFLQITLAYAIVLYYSEIQENDLDVENAIWLGIVTMTTVGYGDYVPKSIIGIIVTCIMALMANTVIFSLPVAILNIEFQEQYSNRKEAEKMELLKLGTKSGKKRESVKNKEFNFFNQRLLLIEQRNKEIQELLNRSNKMAKDLTKDLKRLFLSVNDDADQLVDNLNSPKPTKENVLLVKANLYEKLMRAKKKIQVTNIFRNIIQDSDQEIVDSPLNQTIQLTNKQKSFFKMLSDRKVKRKVAIKSHSCGNLNELLILRNEEYGELPFDFLNEVLLQMHDDFLQDIEEHPNQQQQKRSFVIPDTSDILNREQSFRINSLLGFDSPVNKINQSNCQSSIKKRKVSDFTSFVDKKTVLNLKSTLFHPFSIYDNGQRSITEISKNKKKDSFTQKQIDEMHYKTKPRAPRQFINYNNNLKELDSGILRNESRLQQQRQSVLELTSPKNIDMQALEQQLLNELQNNSDQQNF